MKILPQSGYGRGMRVTRWGHSCVRLEAAGRALVVDPGIWTEDDALAGADAVLLTHHHRDHADLVRIGRLGVPVVAPSGAELGDLPVTRVTADETFEIAGFTVLATGGWHAAVVDDAPAVVNLGYLVGGVYHPGDALHVPDVAVTTLLVPMQASWLATRDAISFVRAVSPAQAVGIHDGQINSRAIESIGWWLRRAAPCGFDWVPPGTDLVLPG